jgi:CheY-like chemotaxis protein
LVLRRFARKLSATGEEDRGKSCLLWFGLDQLPESSFNLQPVDPREFDAPEGRLRFQILRSLRELLGSDGFDAQIFDSPERFMDYARTHSIRLAVLDVWMPTQNGIQLQERLRTQSPHTAVIIITGRDETNLRTRALEGGAFAFLVKPFDDEEFLDAVRGALGEPN